MTELVEISNLLASLVHYPRIQLLLLFLLCAVIPGAAVAWFWTSESLHKRANAGSR